jgi:hypothetical protein
LPAGVEVKALSRYIISGTVLVLILVAGIAALRLGNGRDDSIPAQFSTPQQAGLVDRGPASSRVALVIGIDHYRNLGTSNQLERAKSDARAVAVKLKSLGYDTILDTDATRAEIYNDLDRAVKKIKPGGAAVFYFAGHGIAERATNNFLDGANYLVPSDAKSPDNSTATSFEYSSVPLISIIQQFRRSGARISVLILDSCRDSPFQGHTSAKEGEGAKGHGGSDFYILYSASPGQTALDRLAGVDANPNSVFTRVFLKHLSEQVRLEDMTRSIESGVSTLTSGLQTPIAYNGTDARLTLTGDVTKSDRPFATVATAVNFSQKSETSPIANDVQQSVDMARTAEADAREWAHSAEHAQSQTAAFATQADDAKARSEKGLAGYGKVLLDDGADYEGELVNGEPTGVGVAVRPEGYLYRGQWSEGKRAGFGFYLSLKNHYTYSGEWHDGKQDGAGVYTLAAGEVYRGEWHEGSPDGFGVESGGPKDTFRELAGQFFDPHASYSADASYSVEYERANVVVYGMTKHGRLEGPAAKLDRAGKVLEQGYYEDDVLKTGM